MNKSVKIGCRFLERFRTTLRCAEKWRGIIVGVCSNIVELLMQYLPILHHQQQDIVVAAESRFCCRKIFHCLPLAGRSTLLNEYF